MKTYQDLLRAGQNVYNKGEFCRKAVKEFMSSKDYQTAKAGEAYYSKHNLTIERYQKTLMTLSGREVSDIFSSNYKIKTLFFRRLITQQVQYVLGNGLTLTSDENKEKLGKSFDYQLQQLAKRAMASGKAFGYWNYDHLEVFGYCDTPNEPGFCPLYDEKTARLMAGIRFWFRTIGDKEVFRATLYEEDGITEYRQVEDDDVEVLEDKHGYIKTERTTRANGVESVVYENYNALPIIPLYANDTRESELVGIREAIDAYDLIKSGLANNIDDYDGFYWVLKNSGGMDDVDLAKFVQRIKSVHAASVDGDDGQSADAHTLAVPHEARESMLEILRKDIYEDFQALDVNTLSASAKTTQEIQASYQAQDNKCADFEYSIIEFVDRILELAGIDDNPTFIWNRVVNQSEQTNMVLSASQYLSPECIIRHLPFLTPEEALEEIENYNNADFQRFNGDDE